MSPLTSLVYLEKLSLRDNPIADTFPLRALLDENPNLRIDIKVSEVKNEEGGPTLMASTPYPLTAATLNGSVVTLTLSSGAFVFTRSRIRDAMTISGITGITFHWSDIEKVSDTEVRIELTFEGNIDTDTMLIFTVGPGAIEDYNGPALTAEISVTVRAEPSVSNTTLSISPSSVASPAVGKQLEFSLNITGGESVAGYEATV